MFTFKHIHFGKYYNLNFVYSFLEINNVVIRIFVLNLLFFFSFSAGCSKAVFGDFVPKSVLTGSSREFLSSFFSLLEEHFLRDYLHFDMLYFIIV